MNITWKSFFLDINGILYESQNAQTGNDSGMNYSTFFLFRDLQCSNLYTSRKVICIMHFRVPKFIGEVVHQAVRRVVHLEVRLEARLEAQTFLAGSFREVSYLEASCCRD